MTDEAGTGFVHTAPSHGEDDFEVWIGDSRRLQGAASTLRSPTRSTSSAATPRSAPASKGWRSSRSKARSAGEDGPANKAVMEKLIAAGALLARGMTTLRDAHSWRSKAPVIRRGTPQWFIAMDRPLDQWGGKTLRELCLSAIDATAFTPERGRQRIRAMVEERPDWLISRQRAWGVPLTLFVNRETGEILKDEAVNKRIIDAVEKGGADAWFGGRRRASLAMAMTHRSSRR